MFTMRRFSLKSSGVVELLKDAEVRAELTRRAEQVLAAARASAPVATGAYRDGLHVEQHVTDRAAVWVKGSTDHDIYVEADTGNLARALDAAR